MKYFYEYASRVVSREEGKGADKVRVRIQVPIVSKDTISSPNFRLLDMRTRHITQRIDSCISAEMNQEKL